MSPDSARYAFRPTKGRGQNFLIDPNIIRRFADVLDVQPEDPILEIGPGKGALTEELLRRGARVYAIEIEASLAEDLQAQGHENLSVVQGNALDLNFAKVVQELGADLEGLNWKAISNVPYSISGPLLVRLLSAEIPFQSILLGLQREVADRLVATPGSKAWGSLGLLARAFGTSKRVFKIAPGCYRPRPKVESAAVLLRRSSDANPVVPKSPREKVLRAAFRLKRKTLENSLASGLELAKPLIREVLLAVDIDPRRRAETLELFEFEALAKALLQGPLKAFEKPSPGPSDA